MGLMDFIKKQFIDILEWTEAGDGTLAVYQHARERG